MILQITPGVGLGPIRFGMSRHEVHETLGVPIPVHFTRDMFLEGLFVDYGLDDKVEFIEAGKSGQFTTRFQDRCLTELIDDEAVSFLSGFDSFDANDPELGYSFIFPKLGLSLWRSTVPESAEDPEGRFFEAVGLGPDGYFASR